MDARNPVSTLRIPTNATPPHGLKKTQKLEHRPPSDAVVLMLQVLSAPTRPASTKPWPKPASTRLGRGHLDRRDQLRHHRRQPARAARRQAAPVLGDRQRSPFGFDGALRLAGKGDAGRAFAQRISSGTASLIGVPGFYAPRACLQRAWLARALLAGPAGGGRAVTLVPPVTRVGPK